MSDIIESTEEVDVPALTDFELTDKISSMLSGEAETPEEIVEPEPQAVLPVPDDLKVKVKVNGEEQEVSLAELKNGYQRQSDYTQKTQQLSQERQQIEAQRAEWDQYLSSIPMLAQVAQSNIQEAIQKANSEEFIRLAQEDPGAYIAEKAKLERLVMQNQQAIQQMGGQWQQYQQVIEAQQAQALNAQIIQTHEALSRELPGWADGTLIDSIGAYVTKDLGLDRSELQNALLNPKYVQVINKARMYDELMSKQNVASKKVQNVPSAKVLQPGNETNTANEDFQKRKAQALRSGNDRDIANLLSELL